jgi:hypothetical protein
VLLLKGEAHLPQLKHRLALVMDHDRDIDIHRDASARAEYAAKVSAFYGFVQEWKRRERAAAAATAGPSRAQRDREIASLAANYAIKEVSRREMAAR